MPYKGPMSSPTPTSLPSLSFLGLNLLSPSFLLGFASFAVGALALYNPPLASKAYEIPYPISNPPTHVFAYVRAKGARDLSLGMLYLVLGFEGRGEGGARAWGARRALKAVMLAHCATTMVDSWLVREEGERDKKWVLPALEAFCLGALMWAGWVW